MVQSTSYCSCTFSSSQMSNTFLFDNSGGTGSVGEVDEIVVELAGGVFADGVAGGVSGGDKINVVISLNVAVMQLDCTMVDQVFLAVLLGLSLLSIGSWTDEEAMLDAIL